MYIFRSSLIPMILRSDKQDKIIQPKLMPTHIECIEWHSPLLNKTFYIPLNKLISNPPRQFQSISRFIIESSISKYYP